MATPACAHTHEPDSGVPDGFARGVSTELASSAAQLAGTPGRGRVIADGPTAAAALAGLAGRQPVIYNAHNLESGFRHELGEERKSLRGLASFGGVLLRSRESWMVSKADMQAAHELCPNAELRLVPNVVDVGAIQPRPSRGQPNRWRSLLPTSPTSPTARR